MCTRNDPPKKISVFKNNGGFWVWDAQDVQVLRRAHRVLGSLVSLSGDPPPSCPLLLSTEEAHLGYLYGFLQIFEDSCEYDRLTPEQISKIHDKEKTTRGIQHQSELEKKRVNTEKYNIQTSVRKNDVPLNFDVVEKVVNGIPIFRCGYATVPTQNTLLQRREIQLDPALLSTYHQAKLSVIKDLWMKGYYITDGSKFGADYLAYPGRTLL